MFGIFALLNAQFPVRAYLPYPWLLPFWYGDFPIFSAALRAAPSLLSSPFLVRRFPQIFRPRFARCCFPSWYGDFLVFLRAGKESYGDIDFSFSCPKGSLLEHLVRKPLVNPNSVTGDIKNFDEKSMKSIRIFFYAII